MTHLADEIEALAVKLEQPIRSVIGTPEYFYELAERSATLDRLKGILERNIPEIVAALRRG